jgi:hypothetical protein
MVGTVNAHSYCIIGNFWGVKFLPFWTKKEDIYFLLIFFMGCLKMLQLKKKYVLQEATNCFFNI